MAGIRDEISRAYREGSALTRLIIINLGVYAIYFLLVILSRFLTIGLSEYFIEWTALPTDLWKLITRPWTLITYMFLHQGFMHILFNILWLYFGGRIFLEYFSGRRLLNLYLLGGLAGGLLYVFCYNVFPLFSQAVAVADNRGASASIMAIIIAVAAYVPNYPVRILVIELKLWMIAAFFVLMDLFNLGSTSNNLGGHLAHLGGALIGYLFIRQMRKGSDITEGFGKFVDSLMGLFKPKPKVRKVYTNTKSDDNFKERKVRDQKRMDQILDKISRSGYDSLSKEEKDYLFKIGKD